jgi:hypothetical protein
MLKGVIALVLVSVAAARVGEAEPRPVISAKEADALAAKVDLLARAAAGVPSLHLPRTMPVTELELRSYLNLTLLPVAAPGVTDVDVRIDAGRITASGIVDMDRVKRPLALSPWNPLALLSGRLLVNVAGRYDETRGGRGRVTVDEIRAGGVSIPISVVQQLVATLTKTREAPAGFDLGAPFRLPDPVKHVRLTPGRVFLDL